MVRASSSWFGWPWFGWPWFGWPGVLLIVGVVAAVYAPALHHAFQYDDYWKILNNPSVRDPRLLREDFELGHYSEAATRLLPNLSFALDYAWFKLQPFGYNRFDLLLHLCNVLLVFALARVLSVRLGGATPHFAWLSAALFGVHPLNSEAVYYCNARPNLMVATFYLGALCTMVAAIEGSRGTLGRSAVRWLICASCALAALLSKEIAITLLVVAPALVYWLSLCQPEPYARWVARGRLPLLALALCGAALLFFTGALPGILKQVNGRSFAYLAVTFADQSTIVFRYLGLWLCPWPGFLTLDHSTLGQLTTRVFLQARFVGSLAQLTWPVLASVSLLGGLLYAWRRRGSAPIATFAVFFAALAHAPLWLLPRGEVMVEYRSYLPMVGLCMLLAHGLDRGSAWLSERWQESPSLLRRPGYALVLASLCVLTVMRGDAWATEEQMWNDVLAKTPNSARAYLSLGELARRAHDLDSAIRLVQRSVELDPTSARAWSSLGGLLAVRGDLEAARQSLRRAFALDPKDFQAANNIGNVLTGLGQLALAKRYYAEALAIQPLFPEAELNLGHSELRDGHFEAAMAHYRRALQLAPDLPAVYLLTGRALLDHGELRAAIDMWSRGLRVDARQPAMHAQLAQALVAAGQREAALRHLQVAVQLAPQNPDVVAAARGITGR